MKKYDDLQIDLKFDNEDSTPKFFNKIKTEYLKGLFKVFILIMFLIFIYITHQFLISLYNQIYLRMVLIQIITWILFSFYLIIHFFFLAYTKFSPTLIKLLKQKLLFLGFKPKKKFKMGASFFLFNFFSVTFLILISTAFYLFPSYVTTFLVVRVLLIYMILGITIPILRGILHDGFIVKLRSNYFIQLEIQIKLIKRKENESQMVRIYMKSNHLGLKSDEDLFNLYKKISEKRWLPRKGRFRFPAFLYKYYLNFREYSTPINFKEHFLNLVSAIREWDIHYKEG